MCCNQEIFQQQEYRLRTELYAKDILNRKFKNVDYWTYTASTDGKYHVNKKLHKIEVPTDDSLNGTYEKTYQAFKHGLIREYSISKELKSKRIGETLRMDNGHDATIIDYKNTLDIKLQFDDGTIVDHKTYGNFKKRKISKDLDRKPRERNFQKHYTYCLKDFHTKKQKQEFQKELLFFCLCFL